MVGNGRWFAASVFLLCAPWSVKAADLVAPAEPDPHWLSLCVGVAQMFDKHPEPVIGVDFRPAYRWHGFGTWFFLGSGDGFGVYSALGVLHHFPVGERWRITPSFGLGYFHDGDLDLGHDLEFRTALEASVEIGSRSRVGVMVAHLSNASLSDRNPGTETLQVMLSIPLP